MARPKRFKDRAEYLRWYRRQNLEESRKRERERARKWRKENPERARAQDKVKRERYAERRKEYAKEYSRKNLKDPLKVSARTQLNNAVKCKSIIKPNKCEKCLERHQLNAHHCDYSKPLEVVWLCTKCHALEHHPLPPRS